MRAWFALALGLAVIGCVGGEDGDDGEDGRSVTLTNLPVGSSYCPTGGVRVSAGAEEHFICNGQAGAPSQMAATDQTDAFKPTTIMNCLALTTLPSGRPASIAFNVLTFSDESAFVSCFAETTGIVGANASHWYAPWQVGAATKNCQVVSDASGAATGGWWQFNALNGTARATYHDVNTPDDLSFYDFKSADCPTAKAPL